MLKIEITLDPSCDSLDAHLSAIGFYREKPRVFRAQPLTSDGAATPDIYKEVADKIFEAASPAKQSTVFAGDAAYAVGASAGGDLTENGASEPAPKREPGQPSPGHRRRTKAEIAEDEAYFAKQGSMKPSDETTHTAQTEEPEMVSDVVELESIFAERPEPLTLADVQPIFDLAAAAQDAADEARETAALKGDKLTLDDLRKAIGAYQKTHGFAAMTKNIPEILGCPVHQVKDEDLADAIRKVEIATAAPTITSAPAVAEHIAENKPVETAPVAVADVKAALQRYARKYDGRDDLGKDTTPITNEDGGVLVKQAVGADNLRDMPKDEKTLALLIAAIDTAIVTNPFQREVRS